MERFLPTGTVTLLLADVEGSTRLWESLPEQMTAAIERLDATVAESVAANSGVRPVEQGEGDSFVVAFARASDAVACALALQRAPLTPIRLRIGLHTGEIRLRDGANYVGPTINRTARIRDLAHGGQTVLSGVTEELVAERLPADVWLIGLGSFPLRGVAHPERVVQLCHPDLDNEFPPLRISETAVGGRLPTQLTSFVGRAAELAELRQLVSGNRLTTLTGAGGVGKTRLATQLAGQLAEEFDDGVWWVDLAPLANPDLVAVRVAHSLGLGDQPGRSPTDTLARFIADRRMLVVLDNCEHLVDACATLVQALLEFCSGLAITATSREPLGVGGEVTWRTPPLALADEAVELFAQRARLARLDFTLAGDNVAAVAEICRRLDGVALAIELAAARVRVLSPVEILAGLRDRFRLLTGGARTALPHHQTLRASVDWSYESLNESERVVFRRVAVFRGGFDRAAAHAVAGDASSPRYQPLQELCLLVDKSLLVAHDSGDGTRYRLLETVRHYALDKLAESGEADAVRTLHRDHYTALFDTPLSVGLPQRIERAEIEIHNLRAAFAWSRDHGDVVLAARLASSLQPLWILSRIQEGLAWFDLVLADSRAVAPAARARTLADRLILGHLAGSFDGVAQADEALTIARELDDPDLLARVLTACGVAWIFSAEVAGPYFAEAVELTRALGDNWQLSWVLGWQADSAYVAGEPLAGRAAAEEGCGLADAIGDGLLSRMCRWFLGCAQWLSADLAGATAQFSDVVAQAQAADDALWQAYGLYFLSKSLAHQGDTAGARAAAEAGVDTAAHLSDVQQALIFGALAEAALAAGDVSTATTSCDAAWQTCPQHYLLAVNGYPVAQAALARGDLSAARRWSDEAVSMASGAHRMVLLATRARVAIAQGDSKQADLDAHDALAIAAQTNAYLTIPDVLECLAALDADSGSHLEAARLFGAAQAIREQTGQVRFKIYDADYDAALAALRNALDHNSFEAGWAAGVALSAEEAINCAQRRRGPRKRPSSGWASLTPSERDIVRLVGTGLSNKQIAARLFVSPRTVQTHLTHVYTKLSLTSRVLLAHEASTHL